MTSRWPSVVSSATFAPLRSSSALVATVVPCTRRSVAASIPRASRRAAAPVRPAPPSRRATGPPASTATSRTPSARLIDGDEIREGAADVDADPEHHEDACFADASSVRPCSRSCRRASADRFSGGPQPPPPEERISRQSPGRSSMPTSLVRSSRGSGPRTAGGSDAARRPRRRACRRRHGARRRPRCCRARASRSPPPSRGTTPRPPRCWPSPPEPGRNSCGGNAGESAPRRLRGCRISGRRPPAIRRSTTSRRRPTTRRRRAAPGTCAR